MMLSGNFAISLTTEEKPINERVEVGLSLILITLCAVLRDYTPGISNILSLDTRFSFSSSGCF